MIVLTAVMDEMHDRYGSVCTSRLVMHITRVELFPQAADHVQCGDLSAVWRIHGARTCISIWWLSAGARILE